MTRARTRRGLTNSERRARDDARRRHTSTRVASRRVDARTIAMTSFEYIEPRTRVEIHGIKAKPELNGRVGTVMEYVPARARYRVEKNRS